MRLAGGSVVTIPEGSAASVAIGNNTMLTFANGVQVDEVTLPSGTRVTTPPEAAMKGKQVTMTVPPLTRIIPPSSAAAEDDSQTGKGQEIHFTPAGAPSTITTPPGSMIDLPLGVRSSVRIPTGCKFFFALGQKRHMMLPGGTQLHVPLDKRVLAKGTREEGATKDSYFDLAMSQSWVERIKDATMILPAETVITLPAGDSEHTAWDVQLPTGSVATVTASRCFTTVDAATVTVTVPELTHIDGPRDGIGSDKVPAGASFTNTTGIPMTLKVGAGSIIHFPEPLSTHPKDVAQRMLWLGPKCVGVALGAMDPFVASGAMDDALLVPEFVAACFRETRPETLSPIVRRMNLTKLANTFRHIGPSEAGSIIAGYPAKEWPDMLKQICAIDGEKPAAKNSVWGQQLLEFTENFSETKHLLLRQVWRPHKATNTALKLSPKVAGKLLAGSSAFRAAQVMNNSASMGYFNASSLIGEMSSTAELSYSVGIPYKHQNTKRALLAQQLAGAKNDVDLFKRSKMLMEFFLEGYGVACTLTRVDSDDTEEPTASQDCNEGQLKGGESGDEDEGEAVEAEADEGAPQKSAEDDLEVVASTEAVFWGAESSPGHKAENGISVHMDAKMLAKYQEEALAANEVVYRGVLMLVPIVLPDGTKWGAISHIMTGEASKHLLNDLRPPSVDSLPKALECLRLMAAAVQICVEHLRTTTREIGITAPILEKDVVTGGCMRVMTVD
eukprot:gene8270-9825_t